MATSQRRERKCRHCSCAGFTTNLSQASAGPVSMTGPARSLEYACWASVSRTLRNSCCLSEAIVGRFEPLSCFPTVKMNEFRAYIITCAIYYFYSLGQNPSFK